MDRFFSLCGMQEATILLQLHNLPSLFKNLSAHCGSLRRDAALSRSRSPYTMQPESSTCRRCGNCCREGGPALHRQDLPLFRDGVLSHADLITVRRGEPSVTPPSGRIHPSSFEFVKLAGTGGSWSCRFFDQEAMACTIYLHRPFECRLLECRAPEALLDVIGKDTLSRKDLINEGDPVLDLIRQHEESCSYEACNRLLDDCRTTAGKDERSRLAALLQRDLEVRQEAMMERGLPAAFEMFVFGRPMFFSVRLMGLGVVEGNGRLTVVP